MVEVVSSKIRSQDEVESALVSFMVEDGIAVIWSLGCELWVGRYSTHAFGLFVDPSPFLGCVVES